MAGPKAGQGMQEGRRYFALARSLIGSAPTGIVNMRMSLNKGVGIRCLAFSLPAPQACAGRVKIASRLRKFIPFFR